MTPDLMFSALTAVVGAAFAFLLKDRAELKLRRAVRNTLTVLVALVVNRMLEQYGVYDVTGWPQVLVIALYSGVSDLTWNVVEDRIGVRVLGPLDRKLGAALIEEGRR